MSAVVVTGAFGLLGRRVVAALQERGLRVVGMDVASPATMAQAQQLGRLGSLETAWVDITDAGLVAEVIARARPQAVLHLAAVIPPASYRNPGMAEAVNVTGTRAVVEAAGSLTAPARVVLASSCAVHGSRNGARSLALLEAGTPRTPKDNYGWHKTLAEEIVSTSGLEWTILRLGAVVAPELVTRYDSDTVFMYGAPPVDGRVHAVDAAEAAVAFVGAIDADCAGRILLVAGDASHQLRHGEIASAMLRVAGVGTRRLSGGRRGDPDDDDAWFCTDWMDTGEAQALLGFQRRTWDATVTDAKRAAGWWRPGLWPLGLPAAAFLAWVSPYRGAPSKAANPWRVIANRFGVDALASPPSDKERSGGVSE